MSKERNPLPRSLAVAGHAALQGDYIAVREVVTALAEAEQRLHLIVSTIYSTHGFVTDGEIDTAAKLRAIERLARFDWQKHGMPRDGRPS